VALSDQKKTILKKVSHLISGLVVALKGYDKIEDHHDEVGAFLILLGLLFISFALFHEKISWIRKHEPWLLWMEGVALAVVSYSYFSMGKVALPLCYAISSVLYFMVGVYFYKFKEGH
jgi:hypothetical protein